jgi:cytochrome c biogenesis protein CcdA
MNNSSRNIVRLSLLLIFMFFSLSLVTGQEVVMHFFWDEGCPHCSNQKPYNQKLLDEFPELVIKSYEPLRNSEHRIIYFEMARELGVEPRGVPLTIIGDKIWAGFAPFIYEEMRVKIAESVLDVSNDSSSDLLNDYKNVSSDKVVSDNVLDIPYFGVIDLDSTPIWVATVLIAIMDGFNPCSLWLLLFLIGILVLTRSRKKMLIVGLTFLLITALAYGVFISGIFSIFSYVQHINVIKYVVGIIALVFALVNIKDYFWYKKGISFTISDKHKPGLFGKMRNILRPDNSIFKIVGATAVLALGVTLVELPCTAGLPVIWSNLVASQGISSTGFLALLATYLLLYLGIEIIILFIALITMNKFDFGEKHGRLLKFISGVIMLVFAYTFIFNYEAMHTLLGVFGVMWTSFILIIVGLIIHRVVLPRLGINVGTEKLVEKEENVEEKENNKKE